MSCISGSAEVQGAALLTPTFRPAQQLAAATHAARRMAQKEWHVQCAPCRSCQQPAGAHWDALRCGPDLNAVWQFASWRICGWPAGARPGCHQAQARPECRVQCAPCRSCRQPAGARWDARRCSEHPEPPHRRRICPGAAPVSRTGPPAARLPSQTGPGMLAALRHLGGMCPSSSWQWGLLLAGICGVPKLNAASWSGAAQLCQRARCTLVSAPGRPGGCQRRQGRSLRATTPGPLRPA